VLPRGKGADRGVTSAGARLVDATAPALRLHSFAEEGGTLMRNRSLRPASFALESVLESLLAGALVALVAAVAAVTAIGCSSAESAPITPTDSGTPGDVSGDTGTPADAPVSTPFPATATKLTGDDAVLGAAHADPNLRDAWGLAFAPNGIAWISANRSNKALLYDALGAPQALIVDVPPGAAGGNSAPTGQIFNGSTTAFMGDEFILAGEDGAIAGWSAGTTATVRVDNSSAGAIYKGLARVAPVVATSIALPDDLLGDELLLATDFHQARIDVFDELYRPTLSRSAFVDPDIPAGFAPFNVAQLGSEVYVTYAKQDAKAERDEHAAGNGYVSVFDASGAFKRRFASRGALDSPWAIAPVPDGFGALSGKILIGNFGDGVILVYDTDGTMRGLLAAPSGNRLFIDGLWALVFFTPPGGAPTLFFTAGPGAEAHGLFGRIDLASP
jgi:uncharacterized protein (TIGR03118 family)